MELKEEININFEDKDYDFVYGIDEYTEDISKIKKQFKRLWLNKKR